MESYDKSALLKYFNAPEDKLLFSKFIAQAFICLKTGGNRFTDFVDPVRAQTMVQAFAKHYPELTVSAFGGFTDAERVMLGFSLDGTINEVEYPIRAVKVSFDSKFKEINHRDVLGAVLGLGVDRSAFGDVVMLSDNAYIIAGTDMAAFVVNNLFKIGRVGVKSALADKDDDIFAVKPTEEVRVTVSSLRVDAVAAACFNIPRTDAAAFAEKGRVFLNWKTVQSASKQVGEGEMLTVRGIGRVRVVEVEGKTKKDKFVLRVLR
jgi:RNA-binding protein YlmH